MKKSNYHIVAELGKGSFGTIYKCLDKNTNKEYALKVESTHVKNVEGQLKQEYDIYKQFKDTIYKNRDIKNNIIYWPRVYDYGHQKNGNKILVMDLFGDNLENIFRKNNRFSTDTILYLAKNMILSLKIFHSKGFIHRDLKPQNFVVDLHSPNIYLIDYGLAKKINTTYSYNRSLKGTVRYASINTHLGVEQSFRDDLHSVAYILLYFSLGKLPWQIISQKFLDKNEGYKRILVEKMSIRIEELVKKLDKPLQEPMMIFMFYLLSLNFTDIPDYDYCLSLFTPKNKIDENLLKRELNC